MSGGAIQAIAGTESALQYLLASLDQVCKKCNTCEEDQIFLYKLLQSRRLLSLISVHNRITYQDLQPCCVEASKLSTEVRQLLGNKSLPETIELCHLLSTPHFKALLQAHDQIARKDFLPVLPDVPCGEPEEEDTVKVVQLIKSSEPLGATVKINESTGAVVVAHVIQGSIADKSGLVHVGDEIKEVNGISIRGKTPQEVLNILEHCRQGTLTFKLVPATAGTAKVEPFGYARAHFSYDPMMDSENPCREAGLFFRKGDILQIISQENPLWWQACHEGDTRIGFIPSRLLQERRMTPIWHSVAAHSQGLGNLLSNGDHGFDIREIPIYEEVTKLCPAPGCYRPLILIGAPGVGRNELKQKLISSDPVHFKSTIPYTSRPPKAGEDEGKDYFFVSREFMEEGIQQGKFVEYGEYKGNLYGTSLATVRSLVKNGCVCVLNPHPQALKTVRTPQLKPFAVFIKSPPFAQLKETRLRCSAVSTFDENYSRGFTDEEFREIIERSLKIEQQYGHMFDAVIVNDDLNRAFQELLALSKKVEEEAMWVPASWTTCT